MADRKLKSPVGASEADLYGSFRPTEQVALAWERTREIAAILNARVIVFQCPKSFLPTRENRRNLTRFFREIDRDRRTLAWEPRGGEWSPELVRRLCAENDLLHCVDPFCNPAGLRRWPVLAPPRHRRLSLPVYRDLNRLHTMLGAHTHLPGPNYVLFNNMTSKLDALRFLAG